MKSSPANHSPARNRAPAPSAAAVNPKSLRAFSVPESVRGLDPFELPLSTRLEAALRRQGVLHLGDLHALPQRDLQAVGNCGAGTIAELVRLIKRAATGEFSAP